VQCHGACGFVLAQAGARLQRQQKDFNVFVAY
jgi:hypothetical protein